MYRKTVLPSGLTVVTENIPYFPTLSLGIWWKTGSRFEHEKNNGISHFIEHMLFKGTSRRSAYEIAREIDAVGGTLNAFTGKEYTCVYARVLKKDLDLAMDIIADMCKESLFQDEDVEKEKFVVAQEIKMVEDSPEEWIYEMFNASYFRSHSLGMPILGQEENVQTFSGSGLADHFYAHYTPRNAIITVTGRIDHDAFVERVEKLFGKGKKRDNLHALVTTPVPQPSVNIVEKDLEHIYICVGTHGVSQLDKTRYYLYLLNAIMGGSMSSHLFQEIRENRGLVYNIYSYVNCYCDVGTFGISTSTSAEFVEEVLRLIKDEMKRVRDVGITESELSFSKEHLKGNLFISLESSETRMGRMAKNEIYFGDYIPLKETVREIEKITKTDVDQIGRSIFANLPEVSLTVLGNVDGERIEQLWKS